jgi:uncharacterized protein YbcV (DUF1398 family)
MSNTTLAFTIDQIKAAHTKVKSGADFPEYIKSLIALGVNSYDTYVSDGHARYAGKDNYIVTSEPKYAVMQIAEKNDPEKFAGYLKQHQQGGTDYPTFCRHSAETGIEKWTVDTLAMTCTYYDKSRKVILTEKIPGA